jgi:hypothetical protein
MSLVEFSGWEVRQEPKWEFDSVGSGGGRRRSIAHDARSLSYPRSQKADPMSASGGFGKVGFGIPQPETGHLPYGQD